MRLSGQDFLVQGGYHQCSTACSDWLQRWIFTEARGYTWLRPNGRKADMNAFRWKKADQEFPFSVHVVTPSTFNLRRRSCAGFNVLPRWLWLSLCSFPKSVACGTMRAFPEVFDLTVRDLEPNTFFHLILFYGSVLRPGSVLAGTAGGFMFTEIAQSGLDWKRTLRGLLLLSRYSPAVLTGYPRIWYVIWFSPLRDQIGRKCSRPVFLCVYHCCSRYSLRLWLHLCRETQPGRIAFVSVLPSQFNKHLRIVLLSFVRPSVFIHGLGDNEDLI